MKKLLKSFGYGVIFAVTVLTFMELKTGYDKHQSERRLQERETQRIASNVPRYLVAPHVVKIEILDENKELVGVGSGSYVDFLGKIRLLTNKHICDQSEGKRLMKVSNKIVAIINISKTHDLCIIKPSKEILTGLKVSTTNLVQLDRVYLVGHPRGLPLTIREGHVMSYDKSFVPWIGENGREVPFIMISTITYPGNSGSPVTNEKGELVGVLFAGFQQYNTEGFMVPRESVIRYLMSTQKL